MSKFKILSLKDRVIHVFKVEKRYDDHAIIDDHVKRLNDFIENHINSASENKKKEWLKYIDRSRKYITDKMDANWDIIVDPFDFAYFYKNSFDIDNLDKWIFIFNTPQIFNAVVNDLKEKGKVEKIKVEEKYLKDLNKEEKDRIDRRFEYTLLRKRVAYEILGSDDFEFLYQIENGWYRYQPFGHAKGDFEPLKKIK